MATASARRDEQLIDSTKMTPRRLSLTEDPGQTWAPMTIRSGYTLANRKGNLVSGFPTREQILQWPSR